MRCEKKKRDGKPCRAQALNGKKYCALHDDPQKAAELGSKGGRRRAASTTNHDACGLPVDSPKTIEQVRDLLAETVAQIKTGQLDTRTANALAYVGTALLRAIEINDAKNDDTGRILALEERLSRLTDARFPNQKDETLLS